MRADWRDYLTKAREELPQQAEGSPLMPLAEMLLETSGSQVVEALAQIRQLAGTKKYRSAMEEAFTALPFAPTYLPLHTQIGELLIAEGRTTEAVEKFLITSQLYSLRGEAAQAVRLLNRVTQMAPMDLSVRSRLIELLTSQGRNDEALQQFIELADIYYHLAELDMARQTYLAGLNLAQQSKANRKWMIQILSKLADIDSQRLDWRSALRVYEQLRTLVPEDPGPHTHLVDLNLRLGQTANAMAELDGYLTLMDNSGQSAKCIDFLKSLLEDRPKQVEFLQRLADIYIRTSQNKPAVETLDALADALMLGGNKAGAIEAIKRIISLNPPNARDYQAALATISK
jgi:tetratricopeptide (TPR) repeat protein